MKKTTKEYNQTKLTGPVPFKFTNDYLFRATLQENPRALVGLICALLEIDVSQVKDCYIENPILLGKERKDKTTILDVKILLNQNEKINIELQVKDEGNWTERSLLYLCRAYDNIQETENYKNLKRTIHIGILDFLLFEDVPDFYSKYRMMNTENHKVYSSKFEIRVLQLTQMDTVPEAERNSELYYWAQLFKASSWEEIEMLSEKSDVIKDTCVTIKKLTADEEIRLQCEAEEMYQHEITGARDAGIAIGLQQGLQQGQQQGHAEEIIEMGIEFGLSQKEILARLEKKLELSPQKALEYFKQFQSTKQ